MPTYNERINYTVKSDTFRNQVGYALAKKAAWVLGQVEPPAPKPSDWDAQIAWSKNLLYSGNAWRWVEHALWIVATNEQINVTATPLDTDVQYMVEAYAIPVLVTMSL
jgi:hypothetical protein